MLAPLAVGNGEFAFTMDVTGLQTFPDAYDTGGHGRPAMPLGTMAQWSFHESPDANGWTLDDVMVDYDGPRGPVPYPARYDFRPDEDVSRRAEPAGYWLWTNPHRFDLGRIGLLLRREDGSAETDVSRISDVHQRLDLWRGTVVSRFRYRDRPFEVTTVCAPDADVLSVRVESPALSEGVAALLVRFPYASDTFGGTVDWSRPDAHSSEVERAGSSELVVHRRLDAEQYRMRLWWDGAAEPEQEQEHRIVLTGDGTVLEAGFSFAPAGEPLPPRVDGAVARAASARHWAHFWTSGAAVSLAGSEDPRAPELERRIVLSQYVTAVNCSGRFPPAETGLVMNSWAGKFHLEMHWWHAAHFAMWGRPELLERGFAWYLQALPVAREIARRQGYPGARWPKHVGPEGRESPNEIGPLLAWQQPHPIHFAELLRRTSADPERIVSTYGEIVQQTAEFMASFLVELEDGRFHLVPPLMPAQETYDPRTVYDPPFELAYFWWGLRTAQEWRRMRGQEPDAAVERILERMAALPTADGVLAAVDRPARTDRVDHPSLLGALGVVPMTPLVDLETMRRTVEDVKENWDWPRAWGWDFPVLSMSETRLGDHEGAVEALLMDTPRNVFLANGYNCQDPMRLPLYLPGNGGLLAAVALLAGGYDGAAGAGDGVPGWRIRAEGFPARP